MTQPTPQRFICVYISTADRWRSKGHTHWFVCKRCLKRIANGEEGWECGGSTTKPED